MANIGFPFAQGARAKSLCKCKVQVSASVLLSHFHIIVYGAEKAFPWEDVVD